VKPLWILAALACLALGLPSRGDEGASLPARPTIRVLGARVRPLKPDGKPWDGDHQKVPRLVYEGVGGLAGFPGLGLLAMIPYRNRPDPFLEVRQGEGEPIAHHRSLQGTFLPTWLLTVEPNLSEGASRVLTFELSDDDLREDDPIGKAFLDLDAALARPGVHVLEGTGGLHDLTLVVRNPALHPDAQVHSVVLDSLRVKVREHRPAGGDWDAGGNPLREKLRRVPHADKLDGLDTVRPDLAVVLVWSDGDARDLGRSKDAFEHAAEGLAWTVVGRTGIGDGLFVRVTDVDTALDDPVGVLYVPLEDLLAAAGKGELEVPGGEASGIERVEVRFHLPPRGD